MALTASPPWVPAPLDHVLDELQSAVHPHRSLVASVGDVTLYLHQREAIALLLPPLRRYGGALLADPVGTGKTWSALGAATHYEQVLIVSPAALRSMWTAALARARRTAPIVTHEALSRGPPIADRFDLVIVDEAHHARNPATRRYKALAAITWGAEVLLLSATPLHNRVADLRALCALFLGSGAGSLEPELLSRLICRRVAPATTLPLPRVAGVHWLRPRDTSDVLQRILALPPAVPPSDGSCAAALGSYVLVRQWCSSDGALVAALDRRLRTGAVMSHRLSQGRIPTRRELAGWMADAGAVQLTLALDADEPVAIAHELKARLAAHLDAARALRDDVRADPARDEHRQELLLHALSEARGKRAVLFTHSIDTARVWFRRLSPALRVACLDGHGGRISTGRISREEVIRAFRPASGIRAESSGGHGDVLRIDGLIATDVLSEGVDLHDAAVVVHLDLPWTIARLDQRVGRLRRIGSPHREVWQYAFQPPVTGDDTLRILARLAAKAGLVDALVGLRTEGFGFAAGSDAGRNRAPADASEALRELTRDWAARAAPAVSGRRRPHVAAVTTSRRSPGCLAAVTLGRERLLIGCDGPEAVTGTSDLVRLVEGVTRDTVVPSPELASDSCARIQTWLRAELARSALLTDAATQSDAHRSVLRALASALHAARHTTRHEVLPEIMTLRRLVFESAGVGAEQAMIDWLAEGSHRTRDDMRRLAAVLGPRARARPGPPTEGRLDALLLLVPR